jgi:hypothetical protein
MEGKWFENYTRSPWDLWENDSITENSGIADTTKGKFEKLGITTVLDMKLTTAAEIFGILGDVHSVRGKVERISRGSNELTTGQHTTAH